jgi:Flp pilus assembly protein TadD
VNEPTDILAADLQRAAVLCDLGRYAEAATMLGSIIAGSPESPRAWCLLSQAELGLGNDDAALRAALAAIPFAPDAEWPHRLASIALTGLERPEEAVWRAREAVRLEPHEWRVHAHLAGTLAKRGGDLEDARAAADRAVELAPNAVETHIAAGAVAAAAGRRPEAQAAYKRALSIDPEHSGAHNELARLHLRRRNIANPGGMAQAATGFATAVRADPTATVSRNNFDLVIRAFLARVAYFIFIDAYVLERVAAGSDQFAARLLPVAALAVPFIFAARFLTGLARPLRGHLVDLIRRDRKLRAAVILETTAVACLFTASLVSPAARPGLAAGAVVPALLGRVILYTQRRHSAA